MSKTKPETCARCHQTKPIILSLVHPDSTQEPLCRDCAETFLIGNEDWPPNNTKKQGK